MFGKPAATAASHFPKLDIAVGTRGVWETPMLMQKYSILELDIMNDRPVKPVELPLDELPGRLMRMFLPLFRILSPTISTTHCIYPIYNMQALTTFTAFAGNGGFVAVPSQATTSSASLLNVQQEPPLQFLMYSGHNGQFSQAQFQSAPNQVLPTPPYTHVKDASDATGTKEKMSNTTSTRLPSSNTTSAEVTSSNVTSAEVMSLNMTSVEEDTSNATGAKKKNVSKVVRVKEGMTKKKQDMSDMVGAIVFGAQQMKSNPLEPDTDTCTVNGHEAPQGIAVPTLPKARATYREPIAVHDLGRMSIVCRHCKALHWADEKLVASPRSRPEFGVCCNSGKVHLPLLPEPPLSIKNLFTGVDAQAKEFRDNIRQYNAAFAFTSLGVNIDEQINHGGHAPYVFRIQGELCHRSGSLIPALGQQPIYSQLYIYDPQAALDERTRNNHNLRRDTLELLQHALTTSNPYAAIYKYASEILAGHDGSDNISIRLIVDKGTDQRRYNLPTADEVAILLPGDQSQMGDGRDIILRLHSGPLQRISESHPAYSPLHYAILFPYGTPGWHWEMRLRSHDDSDNAEQHALSQTRFYAYRLQVHRNEFSTILRGGRLLQQYMVDAWAASDQCKLNFLTHHQDNLCVSVYRGLEDALRGGRDLSLSELGRMVVLPSSYTGGPRYMQQLFQDGMAIGRYCKNVDIFLTMTANPQWPEIVRELLPGQTPSDRPDLVARVFELKKKALLHEILKDGIFGNVVAHIYTIEFQKRGLPHMHLLIFLERHCKLLDPASVDSCIRACWPDPNTEPALFEVIKTCMVHGPCGALNPNAPCMQDGRCSKGYPKPYQAATSLAREGYPLYCRPNDNCTYEVRGHMVDNRWIVPHNPYLSTRYNCHINVECSVTFASMKYINKYIHKGHDCGTLEVHHHDEIKQYINSRYISAAEAAWRLFHFDLHEQSPNVVRLQIHLPGQHLVTFDPDESHEVVLQRAAVERTTLTAFFAANACDDQVGEEARKYTYQEFPQHFVWKDHTKSWAIRQRGFALGCMYFVSLNAGERFYLRTLLTVAKGSISFKDLRTVEGTTYPTFREACIASGLLDDDSEWRQCLSKATEMQTGSRL
ncbi:hypothetical protein A0H81_10535 [Grifola frondosa]|uniref:Helitron helicase-like domain-containing protein n=1 Tax=Grifola frondosa TaxID=5627 RepID=A0A1C7M413_GRIFR|nr:hypothetical protein A0H81_10535 [Grifola frondosa]